MGVDVAITFCTKCCLNHQFEGIAKTHHLFGQHFLNNDYLKNWRIKY